MNLQDQDRENVFHERVSILKDQGYRGFTISKIQSKWDGVQVTASNGMGRTLTGSGETKVEAFKKLIEMIDQTLEIQ